MKEGAEGVRIPALYLELVTKFGFALSPNLPHLSSAGTPRVSYACFLCPLNS